MSNRAWVIAWLSCCRDLNRICLQADWLRSRFPERAWIGVELHRTGADRPRLALLQSLASASGLPLVAVGGVLMSEPAERPLLDAMTAIRLGKTCPEAGLALQSNNERHLRSRTRLARFYPQALLLETLRLAGQCRFSWMSCVTSIPPNWCLPVSARRSICVV